MNGGPARSVGPGGDYAARPPATRVIPARSGQFEIAGVAVDAEQAAAALGLVEPVLEEEPAAGHEVRLRAGDDRADRVEPVRPGDERGARLEAEVALAEVRVAGGDVGRVRDHEIEAFARQPGEPFPFHEPDRRGVAPRVLARDRERRARSVDRDHLGVGRRVRDRDRDRPGAGAEVEHAPGAVRQALEREVDEELGLRPGDQHVGGHLQREAVELALAGEVGDRLAGAAKQEQALDSAHALGVERPLGRGEEPRPRESERVRREHLRLERRQAARGEERGDRDAQAAALSPSAASCSAWCSAASASTISSRSPSMIAAIR